MNRRGFLQFLSAAPIALVAVPASAVAASLSRSYVGLGGPLAISALEPRGLGYIGEGGCEAIMPLPRDVNGRLSVRAVHKIHCDLGTYVRHLTDENIASGERDHRLVIGRTITDQMQAHDLFENRAHGDTLARSGGGPATG